MLGKDAQAHGAPPAAWGDPHFYTWAEWRWLCLLCNSGAGACNVASKKHVRNIAYAEWLNSEGDGDEFWGGRSPPLILRDGEASVFEPPAGTLDPWGPAWQGWHMAV